MINHTAVVRKVKGGYRVYVYGYGRERGEPKSISRTFKTKAAAQKAAKEQRETKYRASIRKADAGY